MRNRLFTIILLNIFILMLLLIFHEKIATNIDSIIMPNSAELCKTISANLIEKLKINQGLVPLSQIENELDYLSLKMGGKWWPSLSSNADFELNERRPKLAIIVPYRDRLVNLELFLRNIHPFLVKQNVHYGVYVVEPIGNLTFNKGISMNVGFVESLKEDDYDCFIFHDVDLIPENDANMYGCNREAPKLLAVAISAFGYSVEGYFKNRYFGGVTAFTKEQFVKINGFSNSYYGWGLEDDDARERVLSKFKAIKRLSPQVGRYYANCHKQSIKNPNRFILYIKACIQRQVTDGLNSLEYGIEKVEKSYLYTKIYISYKNDQ